MDPTSSGKPLGCLPGLKTPLENPKSWFSGLFHIFPQTVLALRGSDGVALEAPMSAGDAQTLSASRYPLYFTVLGGPDPQKHIVESTQKMNFCILAERYATFSLSKASEASEPQDCLQELPGPPRCFPRATRKSYLGSRAGVI